MSEDLVLGEGKWLKLVDRSYVNTGGKAGTWEFATRKNEMRSVCMIAIKQQSPPTIVLVRQFRVPVDAWVVELPAGLIEPGEGIDEAALRELAEETGYHGNVVRVGPYGYNSPGMSDERVACVRIDVTGRGSSAPTADERIEVLELPLQGLTDALQMLESDGTHIDAKLWFFAEGLPAPSRLA